MAQIQDTSGRFSQMIADQMEEKNLSIRDVAEKIDTTYEYIRKLVRGYAHPSPRMLKDLAGLLDIPRTELQEAAVHDRLFKKYGGIPAVLAGKNPAIEPFEQVVPYLTKQQITALLDMANTFKKRNKAERVRV